ncbi:MAG TPA: hypothetical protein VMM81_07485 [Acidimicrobiia bacterium]|nr:hypothetical protein [Acidimicrobiia bacterium]
MRISSASYAYPRLDTESRATIARRLLTSPVPDGTVVLSTCLRVEIVTSGDADHLRSVLHSILGKELTEQIPGQIRSDRAAVVHLARVAAGLESPILGEVEILSQFRQAVHQAEEAGRIGGIFARLMEALVSIGRRGRDLIPGSAHASMGMIAAQAVGATTEVAIFGSGTMATAVATALRSLPAPPRVTLLARRPSAVNITGVEVWPFERVLEALEHFPAVVSATSAKQRPIDDDNLRSVLSARTSPLVLVDMAMPPDFVPPEGSLVEYVDIDALARIADRRPRGEDADAFVADAAAEAHHRFADHHEIAPIISGMVASADDIVERVVQRFAGRLQSEEEIAVLRQAAHTVSRTLLAGPIEYVKRADNEETLEALAEAFGVADE